MRKWLISSVFILATLSLSLPVLSFATELEIVQQGENQSIELRFAYQKKQFFKTVPPNRLDKLRLFKIEKVKGGYYGYYN